MSNNWQFCTEKQEKSLILNRYYIFLIYNSLYQKDCDCIPKNIQNTLVNLIVSTNEFLSNQKENKVPDNYDMAYDKTIREVKFVPFK